MKEEMKVVIAIPTCSFERFPLLKQMVKSIQAGTYKNIHPIIIADGSPRIYEAARNQLKNVSVLLNKKRIDWVASMNNTLKAFDSDFYIYASDDLIFPEDCIENAMKTMQKRFPDGFGLVTIGKKNRSAFGLIGRRLVEHFPNRQVFCPDFIHYGGDSELYLAVEKLGIFAYPPERESQVLHARMKDETWRLARGIRARDREIYMKRRKRNWKWGVDFNLVTKND